MSKGVKPTRQKYGAEDDDKHWCNKHFKKDMHQVLGDVGKGGKGGPSLAKGQGKSNASRRQLAIEDGQVDEEQQGQQKRCRKFDGRGWTLGKQHERLAEN